MNRLLLLAALAAPLAWAQAPPPPRIDITPPVAAPDVAAPAPAAPVQPPAAERTGRIGDLLETHIEEVRRGNRVTEIRVTGADGSPRFTMENRDQRQPSQFDSQRPGLSVPNFLNIQF